MRRPIASFVLACLAAAASLPAFGWEDHAAIGYVALGGEGWAAERVRAESLNSFLEAEKEGLAALLKAFEAQASRELPYYPPLPAALAFSGKGTGAALRDAFVAAIRINPGSPLLLCVKPAAGAARTRSPLPVAAVDPFDGRFVNRPFESLSPGEEVSALEVLATASDEPDHGLDCGLYEDNGTDAGGRYGLGKQPFGNPALDYGSQAPLHMAFSREDPLIALGAPFSRRSLADYRFRLCAELARFAFAEGHPYWGYRFAGWALHYVEDLCQPYHARMLPGLGVFRTLALSVFGSKADMGAAMVLLSNRHALVEDYAYRAMADRSKALEGALAGAKGSRAPGAAAYRRGWLYDEVARRAYGRAQALDRLLVEDFPARYVADPSYDYGAANVGPSRDYDPYGSLRKEAPAEAAALDAFLAASFADMGAYARTFVAYARDPGAATAPRRQVFDLRGAGYAAALAALAGAIAFLARRRTTNKAALAR